MRVKQLVVLFAITVMYAPSAAAPCTEDARSRAEAMPVRIAAGRCDKADEGPIGGGSQSRRSSGLPPRRRHLDRGTAPVALTAARPEGWWVSLRYRDRAGSHKWNSCFLRATLETHQHTLS